MIWYKGIASLDILNEMSKNTLGEQLDIKFIDIDENCLKASMPVNERTKQPFGLLNGGASAALAESVGSMAAWLCVNPEKQACVGIEINCNHIRGKKEGIVIGTARPIHIGASTQVWEIKIEDEYGKLICISRLTLAVIKNISKK